MLFSEAQDEFIMNFACRVCKREKESNGLTKPCPVVGGNCVNMVMALEEMKTEQRRQRMLIKRGEYYEQSNNNG